MRPIKPNRLQGPAVTLRRGAVIPGSLRRGEVAIVTPPNGAHESSSLNLDDTMLELLSRRAKIDAIDDAILGLLNRRAGIAIELGELKRGLPPESAALRQVDRETAILERLVGANRGPLTGEALAQIFEEIFNACLELQEAKEFEEQ